MLHIHMYILYMYIFNVCYIVNYNLCYTYICIYYIYIYIFIYSRSASGTWAHDHTLVIKSKSAWQLAYWQSGDALPWPRRNGGIAPPPMGAPPIVGASAYRRCPVGTDLGGSEWIWMDLSGIGFLIHSKYIYIYS